MTTGGPEISGRRESGPSGLRIFMYVLLALGGLGVLTCGGLIFFAARNPALRQLVETMAESQSAPGTQELRDAGCATALVFDFGSALDLATQLGDQAAGELEAMKDLTMVQCVLPATDAAGLDCDEVAKIYASAVPEPPERFLVQVMVQLSSQVPCQVVYGADGVPVAPIDQYHPGATPTAEP